MYAYVFFLLLKFPFFLQAESPPFRDAPKKLDACGRSGGWGYFCKFNQYFEQKTTLTIDGTIASIEPTIIDEGMSDGLVLKLKVGNTILAAVIGPEWYFQKQDVILRPGDKVVVTAQSGSYFKSEIIRATKIKFEKREIELIGMNGALAWGGWHEAGEVQHPVTKEKSKRAK